jgi:hypothetical protein
MHTYIHTAHIYKIVTRYIVNRQEPSGILRKVVPLLLIALSYALELQLAENPRSVSTYQSNQYGVRIAGTPVSTENYSHWTLFWPL